MALPDGDQTPPHLPSYTGSITPAQARHAQYVGAVEEHMAAARVEAARLVARAQTLVRNGIDLRDPERVGDFISDQVIEAVNGATVQTCGCLGAQAAGAVSLLAEVTHQLAVLLEERAR